MIPSSSLIGPARAFALAFGDLQAVSSRLETMHTECWHPAGPNRDRPTPHRDPLAGPDDVKAPKWDCGLGDERARQGWQRMIWHLRNAEQVATDVLCAAVAVESRPVALYAATGLVDAQSGVRRLGVRLTALQRLYTQWDGREATAGLVDPNHLGEHSVDAYGVDVPRAQWLARQLMGERGRPQGSCFSELEQARYEAQRVVREVGSGKPPAACPQCRRLGSIGQPRKGGLCFACDKRNQRSKRPTARVRQTTVRAWKRSKAEAS